MKLRNVLTICLAGMALSLSAQTHLEGEEYFKADQYDNARTLLNRNLNNSGTDKGVSYYYLGRICLLEKKTNEAASLFQKGIEANPEYAYNYVGLGEVDLLKKDTKAADVNFKLAEKFGKKDAGIQVAIARAYYDTDATLYGKEIEKRIAKARKTNMESPEIYIFEGDMAADQKDWGDAGAKYEMAVTYDPKATGAYVKYANLFRQVNPDYSVNMLKKLLSITPNSALGQRELANAYYQMAKYQEAAQNYGNYVNNPNHFKEDEDRYSFLLFYDGEYQKGYDYATELLKSNPDNFTARRYQFMNAAQIESMADQLLPMAEQLWQIHKTDVKKYPFAPIDFTLIADELNRAKRNEEAVAVLEDAMQEIPGNANFNKQLATVYVDLNDLAKASDAYEGFITKSKEPDYNNFVQQAIYSYYAGAQYMNADKDKSDSYFNKAIENATKASEMAPAQYKPKKILGDVAMAKAPKGEAATVAAPYYSESIILLENSSDPSRYKSDAKAMYNYLGNFYLDKKDNAKAKEYFQKTLELDPENAAIIKLVNSL